MKPISERTHKARVTASRRGAKRETTHPYRKARQAAAELRLLNPEWIRTPLTYVAVDLR